MNDVMTEVIKPTSDRKTRFYKSQKNTFGLLPGPTGSCPGATTEKGGCWYLAPGRKTHTCYVDSLMRCYSGVKGILDHNTKLLMGNGDDTDAMSTILDAEFTRFTQAEHRRAKRLGEDPHLFYRLHWSGDIFNTNYAQAIATTVKHHSDLQFWIYTRVFETLPFISNIDNLAVYLSLDPVNVHDGIAAYEQYDGQSTGLQLCYMDHENNFTKHKEQSTVDAEWLANMKMRSCPVDEGKLTLEGGCAKCKKCLHAKHPIWFKT